MNFLNFRSLKTVPVVSVLLILVAIPLAVLADLRPLSKAMLANLQATNAIGESLSIEDYPAVEDAARELKNLAREIRTWDAAKLGFRPDYKAEFDAYLELQEEVSDKIMLAAKDEDASSVVAGLGEMLEKSCLSCHKNFRDRQGMLKSSTLFMTTFVSAWREINRGILLNDFSFAARGARSISAAGQIMSWDSIVQSVFNIPQIADRNKFREHAYRLIGAADRIEEAATNGDSESIQKGLLQLWNTGCLACHDEFR